MGETDGFTFENLSVYQKSLCFLNTVYDVIERFPKSERYVLNDQFCRAAVSIVLNIAEGYGGSKQEFIRYLKISKGSVRECVAVICIAKMRKYIDLDSEKYLGNQCSEISRMLSGLIKSLAK